MNSAIFSPSGGSVGIGFATPAATVMPIIDQLQKYGETRRGWLGVRIQNVDDAIAEAMALGKPRGALIAGIDDKGPAKQSELKTGDVIVKFNGQDVKDSADLPKIVAATPPDQEVGVTVMRDGKETNIKVKLGRLEDNEKQAALEPGKAPQSPPQAAVQKALGMEFAVVTKVDPNSVAAEKRIQAGDTIVEIANQPVKQATDVAAGMKAAKEQGRKTALFLIASASGDKRFVALPVE